MNLVFEDHFDSPVLDSTVWVPHYLPAWSSQAETAATYAIRDSCLHLSIPPHQGLWLPNDHSPLRVSGIQTGNFSGPVGSTVGQQPFRDGLVVREEQKTFRGWTPNRGHLEMCAKAVVTQRSMVGWWLAGFEDVPEHSAEILVFEIFGDAVVPGQSADVGMGLRAFRDPAVTGDFEAVRLPIDPADFHTYAIDWTPDRVDVLVDGEPVEELRATAVVPDADADRRVRLPGEVDRQRPRCRARADRRLPPGLRAMKLSTHVNDPRSSSSIGLRRSWAPDEAQRKSRECGRAGTARPASG